MGGEGLVEWWVGEWVSGWVDGLVDGVNPVATMDGQVYDRGYIEQWIRSCRQRRQAVTSPATGLTLVSTNLVALEALRQAIQH